MLVRDGFVGSVGNTPLIRLARVSKETGCEILGKAEFLNPGGSVKDRLPLFIIQDAERHGTLKPAARWSKARRQHRHRPRPHLCGARISLRDRDPGQPVAEKMELLRTLGAEVRAVPPKPYVDNDNYQKIAGRLAASLPNAIWANQFDNVVNRQAHIETTGPEILRDTNGKSTRSSAPSGPAVRWPASRVT